MNSEGLRPMASRRLAPLAVLLAAGCGPPQVEPERREVVLRLATAASVGDPGLLEEAADEVDRLREAGTLSDAEAAAFDAIIAPGRSGDWERARRRAYALRDAQRPTAEDVDRVRARTLPPPKTPGAGGPPG